MTKIRRLAPGNRPCSAGGTRNFQESETASQFLFMRLLSQEPSSLPNPTPLPTPLHLLRDEAGELLPVKRKPGRPAKIMEPPTPDEYQYAQALNEQRAAYVESDGLVTAIEQRSPSTKILDRIIEDLAVESAVLRLAILSAYDENRIDKLPQTISRRIDCLQKASAILIERSKRGILDLNPRSEPVQRVFDFFLETISKVAAATLTSPADFAERCKSELQGWEDRVE